MCATGRTKRDMFAPPFSRLLLPLVARLLRWEEQEEWRPQQYRSWSGCGGAASGSQAPPQTPGGLS